MSGLPQWAGELAAHAGLGCRVFGALGRGEARAEGVHGVGVVAVM
jgi:hypothetical protein